MIYRTIIFCCLFIFLTSCDNLFYDGDLLANESIEGTWERKVFYINDESIVFDVNLQLKDDQTFRMIANVLGKKNTSYLEYDWTGTWKSPISSDKLEFSYDNDFGIIGYYLDEDIDKENYLLITEGEDLILSSTVNGERFKLVLGRVD